MSSAIAKHHQTGPFPVSGQQFRPGSQPLVSAVRSSLDSLVTDIEKTTEVLRRGRLGPEGRMGHSINLEYLIADLKPQAHPQPVSIPTQHAQPIAPVSRPTKQGVAAPEDCGGCRQPIIGQVVLALGRMWHPQHFLCSQCNEQLSQRMFFEKDGKAYCEKDYHQLFSPRCAYCQGPITQKCITALDQTWHLEHFLCSQCNRPFGNDGFHEREGQAFCRNCYFDNFAPKCRACDRTIQQNYITALGTQWHPECFVCTDCRQPFLGGSFFDHEGAPFCERHYHEKRSSLCEACSQPITKGCVTALGKKYHPNCFVCCFCLQQLTKGTFKEQEQNPYCHECFNKLFS